MAYINGVSLETEYTSPPAGNTFSYATIQTSDDFPDQSQIILRWEMVTVETTGGAPVQTAELTASIREQIFQLDTSYLTFNESSSTVTVDGFALSGATVTTTDGFGATTDYVYPDFSLINNVNPVYVRRSMNVTNPVVDFQGGSRLSSGQLNASVQQLLFAAQEQTVFGTSSDASDVDLGTESINNLGDVNINLNNQGALLSIDANGVITDSTTGGVNEVLSVNGETGFVVLNAASVGAWDLLDIPDVAVTELTDVDMTNISPLAEGDSIAHDGVGYVARRAVEIATGTGSPPLSWQEATYRQVGDIYIRYEE